MDDTIIIYATKEAAFRKKCAQLGVVISDSEDRPGNRVWLIVTGEVAALDKLESCFGEKSRECA